MSVTTTKIHGYRTIIREMMEWVNKLPGYNASAYNPYVELESFLFEVMNELDFIEDDLQKEEAVVEPEPTPVERGE